MKHLNRWVYGTVGTIILLFAGLVYAWTVLQAPIAAAHPEWSKWQLSLTFTITMICFCLSGVLGGILQKRWPPRYLVWISAVLFLAGFFIAAKSHSLAGLYLGFGVLAGSGSGLAYNGVLSAVSAWFPDRQGFISGVLLMGFGLSSFLVGKVYTAVTPSDGSDLWRSSFLAFGAVLFVVMAVAGAFVVRPSREKNRPEFTDSLAYEEIGPVEMLRRPTFWLFMVWVIILSAAGLAVISQGTPMALEACPQLSMNTVATVAGLLSIFNGIGRIIFGGLFDKMGRFWTMLLGGLVFLAAMLLLILALTVHKLPLLVIAYIVTGLGYGCVTPTNSAFVNRFYGQKNYPINLSVVNMNMIITSSGSTIAGAVFDATRTYTPIIFVVAALVLLASVVSCFIQTPKQNSQSIDTTRKRDGT